MKMKFVQVAVAAAIAFVLCGHAQAQHARVQSVDAAQARAAIEASMKAAARGQSVGMLTGTPNPQPVSLPGGGVAHELDASTMVYSVARINADGTIERVCVSGAEAADKAMLAPAFAKRFSPQSKVHPHVSK